MPAPYSFTTAARLQKKLSVAGVNLRVDDDPDATADVIRDATVEVLGYTELHYDPEHLGSSAWIELKTREIAAFYLCSRRANPIPKSIATLYEKAIADLEKVQSGYMILPDVAQRKANVPVLTNQRVAQYPFPRVVNVEGTSTGTPENYINFPDRTDTMDYSI